MVKSLRIEGLEDRTMLTRLVPLDDLPLWRAQGPEPIISNSHEQGGAIRAVAVHPTNKNILYVATVNGGIWKTENATYSRGDDVDNDDDGRVDERDEVPNWRPVNRSPSGTFNVGHCV